MEGEPQMKLKAGWTLTDFNGEYIAVPTGESAENFRGIVRLNETGKDVWQGIAEGLNEDEIVKKILKMYKGVDYDRALKAVRNVVDKLKKEKLLEE